MYFMKYIKTNPTSMHTPELWISGKYYSLYKPKLWDKKSALKQKNINILMHVFAWNQMEWCAKNSLFFILIKLLSKYNHQGWKQKLKKKKKLKW